MNQEELSPALGARRGRKRVGRGDGSGHGTYSGRGCKGQNARAGGGVRLSFEGGQLPLVRRLPYKRGFTNIFRKEYTLVKVGSLNIFPEKAEVNPEEMVRVGLVQSLKKPVKVLGDGELTKPLLIKATRFSTSARQKIVAAGGEAVEIS